MSYYFTGGSLQSGAPSYVERRADQELLQSLLDGQFCYVLTSRQMGKSSLVVHTATRLRAEGIKVAAIDLTSSGVQNVTADQWYRGLLDTLGQALDLEEELEAFWQDNLHLGPLHRLMKALQHVVLSRLGREDLETPRPAIALPAGAKDKSIGVRLVIFVDEIDSVRSLHFESDEFFAAIRECYNHRPFDPAYHRVTFCLLGVASPSDLIRDTRTTPFNIGRRIELNDFTSEEAAPLAKGLQFTSAPEPAEETAELMARILYWTKGHPYLTQRLCQTVAALAKPIRVGDVDQACQELFLSHRARERDENLTFVRDRLLRNEAESASVLSLYGDVLNRRRKVEDAETNPLVSLLRLSGIVRTEAGKLVVRNRIYEQAFDLAWIEDNLPGAELRRQRKSYLRGLIRAATVAAVVLLMMAALMLLAFKSRNEARDATWTALRQQARLSRVSGFTGQRFEALDSIRQAAKIKKSAELRDEAIACLAMPDWRSQPVLNSPAKDAAALVFSDDLELYASSNPNGEIVLRRASDDGELKRWSAGTKAADRIWFSREKQYLAVAHVDDNSTVLTLWRCPSGEALFALTNRMHLEAFDFHPDGRQIAVGGENGSVRILTLPGGEPWADLDVGQSCSLLRFDPGGRRLAIGSVASLKIGIHDATTGNPIKSLHSPSPPQQLVWHPDGQLLAAAGQDHQIRLWDVEADEFAKVELPRHGSEISALGFSHSGELLASAYTDQTMRLWDAGRPRLLLTSADSGSVHQLKFSPDDRRLGLAGSRGMIRFMEVAVGDECRTLSEFDAEELNALDIHPGGRLLAVGHRGGITFWDLAHSRKLGQMPTGDTAAVRFHPVSGDLVNAEFRGTYCFTAGEGGQAGEHLLTLRPKEDFFLGPGAVALDFSTDADVLAVAYGDRIRLAKNTKAAFAILDELIGEPGFQTVALSPNGRQVAAANWKSGDVWLWDRASGAELRRLRVEGRAHVCFSVDGRWLATGTEKKATLWDTQSWQPTLQVERPPGVTRPAPVAFAKTGSVWAMTFGDASVRLLDLGGRTIANLEPPQKEPLLGLKFSPDGTRLACATTARTVLVWDLDAVALGLAQLGLRMDLKTSPLVRPSEPRLTLEIGALDRLRFSKTKYVLELRRAIAELTNLIRKEPGAWHYYMHRAEKYRQLREYGNAVEDYHRWIELDRAAGAMRPMTEKAWPLRDLALLHLFGPPEVRDYDKALALTQQALKLDPANPDNHFRYGIACYRLGRFEEATTHLETSRQTWEEQKKDKDVASALFYEAMCRARRKDPLLAHQLLQQARQAYERTDLGDRKSLVDQLSDLVWEAERIVGAARSGG